MRMRTTILTGILMAAWAAGSRGQELFTDENRFYLAPIVGTSWAALVDEEYEPLVNGNLFTAGGAGGMAFAERTDRFDSSSRAATATSSRSTGRRAPSRPTWK